MCIYVYNFILLYIHIFYSGCQWPQHITGCRCDNVSRVQNRVAWFASIIGCTLSPWQRSHSYEKTECTLLSPSPMTVSVAIFIVYQELHHIHRNLHSLWSSLLSSDIVLLYSSFSFNKFIDSSANSLLPCLLTKFRLQFHHNNQILVQFSTFIRVNDQIMLLLLLISMDQTI
jgi:hypothetical protein